MKLYDIGIEKPLNHSTGLWGFQDLTQKVCFRLGHEDTDRFTAHSWPADRAAWDMHRSWSAVTWHKHFLKQRSCMTLSSEQCHSTLIWGLNEATTARKKKTKCLGDQLWSSSRITLSCCCQEVMALCRWLEGSTNCFDYRDEKWSTWTMIATSRSTWTQAMRVFFWYFFSWNWRCQRDPMPANGIVFSWRDPYRDHIKWKKPPQHVCHAWGFAHGWV